MRVKRVEVGSGSHDIVSLIMSPWRMETPRVEDPSGGMRLPLVFLADGQPGYVLMHATEIHYDENPLTFSTSWVIAEKCRVD